jgi:hypothetical protein
MMRLALELLVAHSQLGRETLFGGAAGRLHFAAGTVLGFGADPLDLDCRGFPRLLVGALLDLAPGGFLRLKRHLLEIAPRGLGRLASLRLGFGVAPLLGLAPGALLRVTHLLCDLGPQRLELAPQVRGLGLDAQVGLIANAALGFHLGLLRGSRARLGLLELGHRLLNRPAGGRIGGHSRRACSRLAARGLAGGLPLGAILVRLGPGALRVARPALGFAGLLELPVGPSLGLPLSLQGPLRRSIRRGLGTFFIVRDRVPPEDSQIALWHGLALYEEPVTCVSVP